jgi:hypothetical protein
MKPIAALALALAFSCPFVCGQSATPTADALTRTFMVQTATERGTIFSIDVDGREYWITAKHLLKGMKHPPYGEYKENSATVQILNPGLDGQQWLTESFAVIDPGNNIDILVLVPSRVILKKPMAIHVGSSSVSLGSDCEFLGFPYGGGWRAKFEEGYFWLPYMKRCSVSGMFQESSKGSPENATVWVLDGMNNFGFSGGPMLSSTGDQQRIFAVVSGYQTEPAEVLPEVPQIPVPTGIPSKAPARPIKKAKGSIKEVVNVNSGFIVAFDIKAAIDAIQKNPIGPIRPASK